MRFLGKSQPVLTSAIFSLGALAAATGLVTTLTLPVTTESAHAKKRKPAAKPISKPQGPLTIVVSLGKQRVKVYDGTRRISGARISSGTRGRRTPTGIFSILQKHRRHYSNLYNSAPMPNMQRITWSGIAMHAGHLPGYPASHGCIRLPYGFSRNLYGITKLGTRVIVAHAQPVPQSIRHDNLLKPLPPGTQQSTPAPQPADRPVNDANANGTAPPHSTTAELLLGVSPANAAETTGDIPTKLEKPTGTALTRASLTAYRERQLIELEYDAAHKRGIRAAAAARVKEINVQVRQSTKVHKIAQVEARDLSATITTAKKGGFTASRNMQVFIERNRDLDTIQSTQKAHQREAELEAELMRHESERDMASKEAVDLAKVIKTRSDELETLREQRNLLLVSSSKASKAHSEALKALNEAKSALKRRERPITVLISRKKMKLYVRQGYDPVFEAPVDIDMPDTPIGTHFYSAYAYTGDGTDLIWNTLTAERSDIRKRSKRRKKSRRRSRQKEQVLRVAGLPRQTPKTALDRINLSPEIKERLAELIKPGSAMIISDHGVSYETGKYTDIIVRTR